MAVFLRKACADATGRTRLGATPPPELGPDVALDMPFSQPSHHRTSECFRSAVLWTLVAFACLFVAAPVLAEVKTVTISRTGANSVSFSVSNDVTGGYHSQMHYVLVDSSSASCSDSTLTYGNASSTWSASGQTYTKTITGNAGKYVCIRGIAQVATTAATLSFGGGGFGNARVHARLGSALASGSAGNSWRLVVRSTGSSSVDTANKTIYVRRYGRYASSVVDAINGVNGVSAWRTGGNANLDGWDGTYYFSGGIDAASNRNDYSTPQGPLAYPGPGLTLNSAGADKTYETGDTIEVTAAFGYNVTVTGSPRIGLTIGSNTRYAAYNSGSGGGNLKFRYAVVTADIDGDGVSIAANALSLNSGTIQDSGNTNAVITHGAVAASNNRLVNAVPDTEAPAFRSNASIDDLSVIQNRAMRAVRFPQASGGDGTLSYSVTPTLPTGLTLNATSGLLSGTPTSTSSETTYTYTVTDYDTNTSSSDKDTLSFKLEVLGEDTLRVHHEMGDGFLRKNGRRTFALDYLFNGPSSTTYTAELVRCHGGDSHRFWIHPDVNRRRTWHG